MYAVATDHWIGYSAASTRSWGQDPEIATVAARSCSDLPNRAGYSASGFWHPIRCWRCCMVWAEFGHGPSQLEDLGCRQYNSNSLVIMTHSLIRKYDGYIPIFLR